MTTEPYFSSVEIQGIICDTGEERNVTNETNVDEYLVKSYDGVSSVLFLCCEMKEAIYYAEQER